jgi:hypothetical protein
MTEARAYIGEHEIGSSSFPANHNEARARAVMAAPILHDGRSDFRARAPSSLLGVPMAEGFYRGIHCSIWTDDKFPFMPDKVQLIWFHVKTSGFSNPLGCFAAGVAALAEEKRMPFDEYRATFEVAIEEYHLFKYDSRRRVVFFPTHFKHKANRPSNPNVLKGWLDSHADQIPDSPLKVECFENLLRWAKTWDRAGEHPEAKRFENLVETFRGTFTKQGQGQGQESGTETPRAKPSSNEASEAFKKAFEIHFGLRDDQGFGAAWEQWAARVKEGVKEADLSKATGHFRETMIGQERPAHKIMMAVTFFGPKGHWKPFVKGVPNAGKPKRGKGYGKPAPAKKFKGGDRTSDL